MKWRSAGAAAAVAPPGFIELHGGPTRLRIVPALGGKIAELTIGGRQWLWESDVIPRRVPGPAERADDASYVETADSGGFDECFPTVGAGRLPEAAGPYAGLALPDHGELWSAAPDVEVRTGDAGHAATLTWRGARMPYRFRRELRVASSGEVAMRYAASNEGAAPMPFLWSAHPLLPLTPRTRLDLPSGARVRVYAEHGIDLGGAGAEHRWPRLQGRSKVFDLSAPDGAARRYACKLFLDARAGWAAVVEGGARLEAAFDPAAVPNVGLWINRRGWTPFRGGKPYRNFAMEPCIGAPDALHEALDPAWGGAHWLQPGETREWEVIWRGRS